MMVIKSIALLLVVGTPASAEPLWSNVEPGMAEAELRKLYPEQKGRVEYHRGWTELKGFVKVGTCRPDVSVMHANGSVTKVKIEKIAMAGMFTRTCAADIYAGLLAKYGQPVSQAAERKNFLDASQWAQRSTIWVSNGITIRLERGLDMHDSWRLIYDPPSNAEGL